MESMQLFNNSLRGSIPLLKNCTKLKFLNLRNNTLESLIPDALPVSSQQLILSQNNLDGPIPNSLTQCTKLDNLDLSGNRFTGSIPLKLASLANNNLSGHISDGFSKMQALKHLDLTGNGFSGTILSSLGYYGASEILYLANNSLTGNIPNSISKCTKLKFLRLGQNRLSGIPV